MTRMRHWFTSGAADWWIDTVPPPEESATSRFVLVEVTRSDRFGAEMLLRRIFANASGIDVNHLIGVILTSRGSGLLPADRSVRPIAQLIMRRRVRVWRRTLRRNASGASTASAAPALEWERPVGKPYVRPGLERAKSPVTDEPPLFWYEFILLDEVGEGLPNVQVALTTPAGTKTLLTSSAGSVRVESVPAGTGTARVNAASLAEALKHRSHSARRTAKLPKTAARFDIVTPSRATRAFTFPHQDPHRVMVVSRADIHVAGSDSQRRSLAPADASDPMLQFTAGELDVVHLVSRGSGESARVEDRTEDDAVPADSAAAAAKAIATQDPAIVPAFGFFPDPGPWPAPEPAPPPSTFVDLDVDPLHDALFDVKGDGMFDLVLGPLQPRPPKPEPFFAPPQAAADAAAVLASVVALEQGVPVDELFQPFDIPIFDPVERVGPRK